MTRGRFSHLLLVALVLLGGAALRWQGLGPMNGMLHYDEAFNAMDSFSLLESPRLVPFLPGNNGRESGWVYWIAPALALWGPLPFGLRYAAALAGLLTLVGLYVLARELLSRREAAWAVAGLAALYWHVHMSHLALRAILYPMVGVWAVALLLLARRRERGVLWLPGGAMTGLLIYTYFAARGWMALILAALGWWWLRARAGRRDIALAALSALITALPMLLYTAANPETALYRVTTVGEADMAGIGENMTLWLGAWLQQGDTDAEFNVPGRPILDAPLALLFAVGLLALALDRRRRRAAAWIGGLAALSVLPSLLSANAPHFLRAVGLTVPIALTLGAGAGAVAARTGRYGGLLAALLLLWAGWNTRQAFAGWLEAPETFIFMGQYVSRSAALVADHAPAGEPVYFSPFPADHAVVRFWGRHLAPRRVGAFDGHGCLVLPDSPAIYASVTLYEPGFQDALSRWADVQVLGQDEAAAPPRYTVFRAEPRPLWSPGGGGEVIGFADAVQARLLTPLPEEAPPGQQVALALAVRALRPLDRPYSLFVHLYGDPTPYEGGPLWASADAQLCASYPSPAWQVGETVIQRFELTLPEQAPPGRYTVAVGLYESPAGARLPVSQPQGGGDYVALGEVRLLPPR